MGNININIFFSLISYIDVCGLLRYLGYRNGVIMIQLLAYMGLILSALSLEAIIIFITEIDAVKRFNRKIKNKIRLFFWKIFDTKHDFIEK